MTLLYLRYNMIVCFTRFLAYCKDNSSFASIEVQSEKNSITPNRLPIAIITNIAQPLSHYNTTKQLASKKLLPWKYAYF
jgi:hypothetical protein